VSQSRLAESREELKFSFERDCGLFVLEAVPGTDFDDADGGAGETWERCEGPKVASWARQTSRRGVRERSDEG